MAMLTTTDLRLLRACAEAALPDTATIQRPTSTQGALGQASRTYSTVATVACRVEARPAGEMTAAGRLTAVTRYEVSLPHGTDVLPRDRILISGRTFEASGVGTPESDEVLRTVHAVEVA